MNHFFAYISRLRLIRRWSLMRNISPENSQEHSWQVSTIAHALAIIKNCYYEGNVNPEKAATLGLYHDISETITGDLPTPIKYANQEILQSYHSLEREACKQLKNMLPEELQEDYHQYLFTDDSYEAQLVKIADKICAYIKCAEETAAGNKEFTLAYKYSQEKLATYKYYPEVEYFIEHFLPSFSLTLDEINK